MEKEVKEFAGQDGVKKADRCLSFKITSRNISEIVWESSYIGSYHKKSCKVLNTNSEPWRTFCFFQNYEYSACYKNHLTPGECGSYELLN